MCMLKARKHYTHHQEQGIVVYLSKQVVMLVLVVNIVNILTTSSRAESLDEDSPATNHQFGQKQREVTASSTESNTEKVCKIKYCQAIYENRTKKL